MLNNYFEKIYCINLSERTDRWNHVTNEFNKIGCTVERFDAIKGNTNTNLTPGEVGCYLSHVNILKNIINNDIKNALIFEDDVVFCQDFNNKFKTFYDQLPTDNTLVYPGSNYSIFNPNAKLEKITDNIYLGNNILATHSYFINNEGAKILLDLLKTNYLTEPVDNAFRHYQSKYPTYVFKPNLVYQLPGHSDVRGGYRDYNDVFIN
jgi:glycosyl transferase family 25